MYKTCMCISCAQHFGSKGQSSSFLYAYIYEGSLGENVSLSLKIQIPVLLSNLSSHLFDGKMVIIKCNCFITIKSEFNME